MFTRKVQPVLVNNCTVSKCHEPGGAQSFQLNAQCYAAKQIVTRPCRTWRLRSRLWTASIRKQACCSPCRGKRTAECPGQSLVPAKNRRLSTCPTGSPSSRQPVPTSHLQKTQPRQPLPRLRRPKRGAVKGKGCRDLTSQRTLTRGGRSEFAHRNTQPNRARRSDYRSGGRASRRHGRAANKDVALAAST